MQEYEDIRIHYFVVFHILLYMIISGTFEKIIDISSFNFPVIFINFLLPSSIYVFQNN